MPIQKAIGRVGIGKQTIKGTPQTTPYHAFGVSGGSFAAIDVKQEAEELTAAWVVAPGVRREEVVAGFNFTTRAYARGAQAILAAILGQDIVSGAGPFVHTCSVPASQALPYLTVRGSYGSTPHLTQISDAMLDEVTLKWDKGGPIDVEVSGIGAVLTLDVAFGTPTNDDSNDSSAIFGAHTGGAAAFKYSVDSGTPLAGTVAGGEIKIKRNIEVIPASGRIVAGDVYPGKLEIDWMLKTVPDDINDWRRIVTGSVGGTTATGSPVYGSADVLFTSTANAAHTLQITSSRVAFLADFPESDPKGGPAEIELKGTTVLPTGGTTPITAIVTNAVTAAF